jgi:diacylglycerol O-acyltransferase-1
VIYPHNLTLVDVYYFVCVPTLCYELNFPRTPRIRIRFVLRRLLELLFGSQLVIALIQQWVIIPSVGSVNSFAEMDLARTQERLLKLAVRTHVKLFRQVTDHCSPVYHFTVF